MKFSDQIRFIRRNMKKNKLRVFMTILATTMSCAFLIVLASVGFGIQKMAMDEILSNQTVTQISVEGKGEQAEAASKEDLASYQNREHVAAIVERTEVYEPVEANLDNRTNNQAQIVFTDMEEELKSNMALEKGKIPESANEIVVGYDFASQLWTKQEQEDYNKQTEQISETQQGEIDKPQGYPEDIVGKNIKLKVSKTNPETGQADQEKTYDFKVVGVTEQKARDWQQDSSVYLSNDFQGDIGNFLGLSEENGNMAKTLNVYADQLENVTEVTNALKDDGFLVFSVTEQLDQMNVFFTIFKVGLIFVGLIAIIISSIGIFNTMTMAVTERTQEIGIMKAVGADPGIIRKIFLMESTFIGLIGSVIGIIISYVVSVAVNFILPLILNSTVEGGVGEDFQMTFSYIPITLVIIATVISVGIATLSGLNPAIKATRTNVLTALRREL
ncbi:MULTISPECIES: ABC transporter permease [Bacillus]|uniref:Macrolide ABC transporter permease n=2 Tax=Bacillus TaxID=1386 RepID=A0A0M4FH98_9BACI|nr:MULTISPECIES: ABC transporter permease [Bacillus]ALC82074.1 macrolide ABC transporter permease [Bacillus gobiensis]MBP1083422.1 acetoin utilization transport system permease protein [Bacillus capparidis]MED1097854.1 ABC transporter permease [Bacillus capparidis]